MPNVSAHMIVAKEVAKRLNLNSDEFYRGNLLPDIIDKKDSHHKKEIGVYLVPDIDYFLENLDLSKDINIGYLTHLLLDKHYLSDYLSFLYPNINIFLDGIIYKDYDYLNFLLVNKFELSVIELENVLNQYDCIILEEKLKYNIECLKQKKKGNTKYLNFESFASFLLEVSNTISKELLDYADKSSKLCIRIGQ
jgi:hypothetical protein